MGYSQNWMFCYHTDRLLEVTCRAYNHHFMVCRLVLVLAPRVFLQVLQFSSLPEKQHFQIPTPPKNSASKSHLMDLAEIPIYLFHIYISSVNSIDIKFTFQISFPCVVCWHWYSPWWWSSGDFCSFGLKS